MKKHNYEWKFKPKLTIGKYRSHFSSSSNQKDLIIRLDYERYVISLEIFYF